jgi:hypothetical protein
MYTETINLTGVMSSDESLSVDLEYEYSNYSIYTEITGSTSGSLAYANFS